MPSARLLIKFDSPARDCVRILGHGATYKRGSISFRAKKNELEVKVEADDAVAMLSSLTSALKQLRVVSSVDSLIKQE